MTETNLYKERSSFRFPRVGWGTPDSMFQPSVTFTALMCKNTSKAKELITGNMTQMIQETSKHLYLRRSYC